MNPAAACLQQRIKISSGAFCEFGCRSLRSGPRLRSCRALLFRSSPPSSRIPSMCPRSSSPKDFGSLFSVAPETHAALSKALEVGHGASRPQERGRKKQQNHRFELLDEYFSVFQRASSPETSPNQCKHQPLFPSCPLSAATERFFLLVSECLNSFSPPPAYFTLLAAILNRFGAC